MTVYPGPDEGPPLTADQFARLLEEGLPRAITRRGRAPLGPLDARLVALNVAGRTSEHRIARHRDRLYVVSVYASAAPPPAALVEAFFGSFRPL